MFQAALQMPLNDRLQVIQKKIFELRGSKVMLDFDLADLYEVETRILNQAIRRNADHFPKDFMFRLSKIEWEIMSSQIVMTYPLKRPKQALPLAFTEHGVAMLANVLKSKKARQTSIAIIRAFISLKQFIANYKELAEKLRELENRCNMQFKDVNEAISYLLNKDNQEKEQKQRKRIGYRIND